MTFYLESTEMTNTYKTPRNELNPLGTGWFFNTDGIGAETDLSKYNLWESKGGVIDLVRASDMINQLFYEGYEIPSGKVSEILANRPLDIKGFRTLMNAFRTLPGSLSTGKKVDDLLDMAREAFLSERIQFVNYLLEDTGYDGILTDTEAVVYDFKTTLTESLLENKYRLDGAGTRHGTYNYSDEQLRKELDRVRSPEFLKQVEEDDSALMAWASGGVRGTGKAHDKRTLTDKKAETAASYKETIERMARERRGFEAEGEPQEPIPEKNIEEPAVDVNSIAQKDPFEDNGEPIEPSKSNNFWMDFAAQSLKNQQRSIDKLFPTMKSDTASIMRQVVTSHGDGETFKTISAIDKNKLEKLGPSSLLLISKLLEE